MSNLTELKDFIQKDHSFFYREGTSDSAIIHENFVELTDHSYNFPEDKDIKTIFDIGANIGVIAVKMANLYPNAKITSFEPVSDNYSILEKNTKNYPNITLLKTALGKEQGTFNIYASEDAYNLGGFSFFDAGTNKEEFETVTISPASDFGVADLIKIDTEGSEYDILTTIDVKRVKYILGEAHGEKDYELFAYLRDQGFDLSFKKPMGSRVFTFYGRNTKL